MSYTKRDLAPSQGKLSLFGLIKTLGVDNLIFVHEKPPVQNQAAYLLAVRQVPYNDMEEKGCHDSSSPYCSDRFLSDVVKSHQRG